MTIQLDLQYRYQENQIVLEKQTFSVDQIGVMVVDTWNYHWCMTAAERCSSFALRMNHALATLRSLGIQIFWGPTDVADQYVGTPQREKSVAVEPHPLPTPLDIQFPLLDCYGAGGCMCGPGIDCHVNYGWDRINPNLTIDQLDLIVEGTQEVYSWCKKLGINCLIFLGFHTNVCTTGKPVGIGPMMRVGIESILARDMTDAISGYSPADGQHPDQNTKKIIQKLESLVPTIHLVNELRKLGKWNDETPVDPVRITPWGTPNRPYQFEESTVVSLSAPLNQDCQIYYTLNGTSPDKKSFFYTNPFPVCKTQTIRTIAYQGQQSVCLESTARFVRLPPKPPSPNIHLSDLEPIRETVHGFNIYSSKRKPSYDKSYSQQPLKLRGKNYTKGIGVEAPSHLLYNIQSKYDCLVGIAGLDESMLENESGRARAMYPSVILKIYINGKSVNESPILRISQEPWRFEVKLPADSQTISLVAVPSHTNSYENFVNWVNVGFLVKQ